MKYLTRRFVALLLFVSFSIPIKNDMTIADPNIRRLQTSTITGKRAILKVKVFAYYGSGSSSSGGLGHAYLAFENLEFNERHIGHAKMIVTGGATVGTWGNQSNHVGLWYNLESYYSMVSSAYDGRVSLTTYLDEDEMTVLHRYIYNYDHWSLLENCSFFAMNAWNLISNDKISAGTICTPKNLANSIMLYDYYEVNRSMPSRCVSPFYVENDEFHKMDGTAYAELFSGFDNPYSWEE